MTEDRVRGRSESHLVAGVNVKAERVPRRIQHHTYVVLRLVHVQLGSEREGVMHCGLEVGHTDVEVHHHLLLPGRRWPR